MILAHFSPTAAQEVILGRPILAARHISCRINIARRDAAAGMLNLATAPAALDTFLGHLHQWLEEHPDKFNHIACSIAMLSVAQFALRPKLPNDYQKKAVATAAVMLKHFDSRPCHQTMAMDDHAISNVLWACARLRLRPDDVQPGSEDRLALRFKAIAGQAKLHSISKVLWSCSSLHINPLKGELLEALVDGTHRVLLQQGFDPTSNIQSLALSMHSFANMRFHVQASTAELIIKRFYEGLARGIDEPQALSNVMWACASLGYSPPPYMLQQFMQSHLDSRKPVVTQHDTTVLWSLAVLGGLNMDFFQKLIKRLPKIFANKPTILQLYIALQALRPQDTKSSAHQNWLQVGAAFLLLSKCCTGLFSCCVQASLCALYPFGVHY